MSTTQPADVTIVGAGPAGSAAAITLARAGLDVVVVDKATFPRDKFCGDGLTTGALRLLDRLGLEPGAVPSWTEVHDVLLCGPGGRTIRFPLPRDRGSFAAVARREELDTELLELARRAGARVLDGHACTGATERADRVELEVAGLGRLTARYAIGADGMWSPLRRFLGLAVPGYRGDSHAFRQYFTGVGPLAASELFVWFEPDLLPGYAWSFPVGTDGANVGFGIHRGGSYRVSDMGPLWPEVLARPHIRSVLGPAARPDGPPRAWPIPTRLPALALSANRTLFVGDAIGAADPLTGEGIGQALASGVWAAEALLAAGPDGAGDATARYDARFRDGLVADHRMSALVVRALHQPKRADIALSLAGVSRWTRRNFTRWLFEDYPRAVIATPSRWRRGMFTRPGVVSTPARVTVDG